MCFCLSRLRNCESCEIFMANTNDLDALMTDLDITNEDEEELLLEADGEETQNRFELCPVGKFLSEKFINTRAISSKMADLWNPALGINIKNLKEGIFLFQFYH